MEQHKLIGLMLIAVGFLEAPVGLLVASKSPDHKKGLMFFAFLTSATMTALMGLLFYYKVF